MNKWSARTTSKEACMNALARQHAPRSWAMRRRRVCCNSSRIPSSFQAIKKWSIYTSLTWALRTRNQSSLSRRSWSSSCRSLAWTRSTWWRTFCPREIMTGFWSSFLKSSILTQNSFRDRVKMMSRQTATRLFWKHLNFWIKKSRRRIRQFRHLIIQFVS